jgi:hypothetical protein
VTVDTTYKCFSVVPGFSIEWVNGYVEVRIKLYCRVLATVVPLRTLSCFLARLRGVCRPAVYESYGDCPGCYLCA